MIYTPPEIHTNNPTPTVVQQQASDAIEALQEHNTSSFIKKLILGHLVKKSIAENEAQGISTGVEIFDMQRNQPIVSHNLDKEHFAASINKVPVALLILEDLRAGRITLDQTMTWQESDVRAGAGIYDQPGAPLQAPLKDVIYDLLNRSGNTAVRVLVNGGLGGAQSVNERWSHIPQLSHTYLQPLDSTRFYLGNTTPRDALWSMAQLLHVRDNYGQFVQDALVTNIYTDTGVRSQLLGNEHIVLANKVGLLDDVEGDNRHDVGIIYNTRTQTSYAYAFLTTSPHETPEAVVRAEQSIKDMGRYTLRFSGDMTQQTAPLEQKSSANRPIDPARILY